MLRDRLVVGINDENIQKRLLSEKDLQFEKARDMAIGMESAAKNARDIAKTINIETSTSQISPTSNVHNITKSKQNYKTKGKLFNKSAQPTQTPTKRTKRCYRCNGTDHDQQRCKFKDAICHYCHKKGHIAPACRAKASSNKQSTHHMYGSETEPQEAEDVGVYTLFCMEEKCHKQTKKDTPISVNFEINGKVTMPFEVDTGSSASIMSEQVYKKLVHDNVIKGELEPSTAILKTYGQESIPVQGNVKMDIKYNGKNYREMSILVTNGDGPTLMGRKWLKVIKLNWHQLFNLEEKQKCQEILDRYKEVFNPELGELKTTQKIKLHVGDATPRYHKARNVPYSMREKVDVEIDRLVKEGILEPVQFSEWGTPIVPVLKKDNTVRICGDYRLTVNQACKLDKYPIPRIKDLYTKLAGGKVFTKLDMSQAYLQLPLDEGSKGYTTITTQKGLFRYTRLPFGIASSPAIFQRTMDNLLQNLPKVTVYLDDILITGDSEEEHLENLEKVLQRLQKVGLRLKRSKCVFQTKEIKYLGYKLNADGLHPTEEKIRAIKKAKTPTNVTELKSYLGLLNYYGKFLPNLSTKLQPLYKLLKKDCRWHWSEEQEKAFSSTKQFLESDSLLVHYDPNKELVMACDASPYGIGAVISHKLEDGTEKPIAFASRTLSEAEKGYSQVEKEGLAVIYGIKKFHQYVYGRHFQIVTDHKPITTLFNESKGMTTMASNRIQRWSLSLSAYDYTLKFKPGNTHSNADALSRLPLPEKPTSTPQPQETIFLMENMDNSTITAKQIQLWTRRDRILSQVYRYTLNGWPKDTDPQLRPHKSRMAELSVFDGCILWGSRIVVPPPGRNYVLEELHTAHPGISRMKSLARGYVWWPKMDKDLEVKVRMCQQCQINQNLPPNVPLHPWSFPVKPWSRLHLDFAGPFQKRMFLILIDAYSKWLEVIPMGSITTQATIETLKTIFCTHGLPEVIVTDNGPSFTSIQFREFSKQNGIRHIRSAPYHPESNGLAERAVQIFKSSIKKMTTGDLETNVCKFLFQYRITPQSTTGLSPAELLLNRKPKSHLDLLYPNLNTRVNQKQAVQKSHHDVHSKNRVFQVDDQVYVRNYSSGQPWIPGVIREQIGLVSFIIRLQDDREVHRHKDQIRIRHGDETKPKETGPAVLPKPIELEINDPVPVVTEGRKEFSQPLQTIPEPECPMPMNPTSVQMDPIQETKEPELRRSARVRKAPEKLNLKIYSDEDSTNEIFV